MRTTHTITGPASLKRTVWIRHGTQIVLALPTFSVAQQENLQARFNRQLSESGNEFCVLALIAAFVGCIVLDAVRWDFFAVHPVTMFAINLAGCLAAAAFGKTVGVLRSRWQLSWLIRAVAQRLEHDKENAPRSSHRPGERLATRHGGSLRPHTGGLLVTQL